MRWWFRIIRWNNNLSRCAGYSIILTPRAQRHTLYTHFREYIKPIKAERAL